MPILNFMKKQSKGGAMKLVNPHYVDAVEAKAQQRKAAVQNWLAANTNVKEVTLDELKLALPDIAADLNKQTLAQIARLIGARIEERDR